MYCQHLPTHSWTNHSELAYLIRDPSPTTPRALLRKRQLKRWMMQTESRRDPPSRRNSIECLDRFWVRPLNTKGTHQWNENELRTACLLRLLGFCWRGFSVRHICIYIYLSYKFSIMQHIYHATVVSARRSEKKHAPGTARCSVPMKLLNNRRENPKRQELWPTEVSKRMEP